MNIQLTLEKTALNFSVKNTKEAKSIGIDGFEEGGIGLVNIQKRLAFIYPDRHEFELKETDSTFAVDLKLLLNHPTI